MLANASIEFRATGAERRLFECEASNALGRISKQITVTAYGNFKLFD